MEQEAGASRRAGKDVALKPVSVYLSPASFTFACSCDSMSWWQIHAPISPTPKEKSPPVSRTFSTRVCVRRASPCAPLTGLNREEGRRLCGLPSSSSQSKYFGKWRRCNKTWPGRGGEWMASVSCMINEKSGFQGVTLTERCGSNSASFYEENWRFGT